MCVWLVRLENSRQFSQNFIFSILNRLFGEQAFLLAFFEKYYNTWKKTKIEEFRAIRSVK